jgi:ABC-type multidrug transport system ATPase subunit
LLEQLTLIPHRSKRVRDLSGGLKQRLALALALLSDPPILFLDEPTASLDVNARNDFLSLLLTLKQAGKTMIFTSHRLEDMITLADRVLVLAQGQLQADCPPTQLTATWGRPSTLYLTIAHETLEPAAALLHQHGLIVNKNGHGLRVQVNPGARGEPLHLLHQAGIAVEDFEIEG